MKKVLLWIVMSLAVILVACSSGNQVVNSLTPASKPVQTDSPSSPTQEEAPPTVINPDVTGTPTPVIEGGEEGEEISPSPVPSEATPTPSAATPIPTVTVTPTTTPTSSPTPSPTPTSTPVPNIIAEYKLGDNVTGTLYDNMNYVISGTGATYDYSYNMPHNTWDEIGKYKLDVQKVVVEEGVTEIGKMALAFFRNCKEIVLPSTLTKISDFAFEECGTSGYWRDGRRGNNDYVVPEEEQWFMKINLEDTNVTEIGKRAFCGSTFEKLIFPETLEIMKDECFIYTKRPYNDVVWWDDIVIPASVRQVGNNCFMNVYSVVVKGKSSIDEFELVTDIEPEQVVGVGGYTPFYAAKLQFEP